MDRNPTIVLASIYVFKTVLKISEYEYKRAHNDVVAEIANQKGLDTIPDEAKNFFDTLSKPNNFGLFHMILTTVITGIYENYDIVSDMPDLKSYLKNNMIKSCNISYESIDLKYIVRRLRNSVSHYNYNFDGTKFVFEDNNTQGNDFFKAEFTHNEIATLVDEIALFCVETFSLQ